MSTKLELLDYCERLYPDQIVIHYIPELNTFT